MLQLSNFTRIRSLDAPQVLHHAPVTTFFHFFFGHIPTFVKENFSLKAPLDAPQCGCPGPSAPPSARHWSSLTVSGFLAGRPSCPAFNLTNVATQHMKVQSTL